MGQKILKIPEDPINSSNDMNQIHGIYFNIIDLSHFIKVFLACTFQNLLAQYYAKTEQNLSFLKKNSYGLTYLNPNHMYFFNIKISIAVPTSPNTKKGELGSTQE